MRRASSRARVAAFVAGLAYAFAGVTLSGVNLGAWLLTELPEKIFGDLVPWLILVAASLFALQPVIAKKLGIGKPHESPQGGTVFGVVLFQFFVGIYGGYFGAGIGILMLSALGFMGVGDIHRMNAVKTFLAASINTAGAVVFVRDGLVNWNYAWPMVFAAILGGYAGARVARRLPAAYVRYAVIVIGFGLSAFYFIKHYASG